MKLTLMCIGAVAYAPFKEAIERYSSRITRYIPFEIKEIADVRTSKSLTAEQQKKQEGSAILNALQKGDWVVLMDERGKEYSSREFSDAISKKMTYLNGRLVLIIGGPYGFSSDVYERANEKMSLSKMTLPHELARLMATEQIYRAMTIIRGEPYHHD